MFKNKLLKLHQICKLSISYCKLMSCSVLIIFTSSASKKGSVMRKNSVFLIVLERSLINI